MRSSTPGTDQPPAGYTVSGDAGALTGDAGTPPMECMVESDCPPAAEECMRSVCMANGFCATVASPAATLATVQTLGDCRVNLCDGAGGMLPVPDDADLADDGNGCTSDTCVSGSPVFRNRPAGASCTESARAGGGAACDGNGQCVTSASGSLE